MNYDNQRLIFIQTMKHDLRQRINDCTDKNEFKELKQSLQVLTADEKQILESMDYLR